ncbi:hypothetical protein QTP70_032176 [Hemibagrus guttatus]|uniref:Urea transporter n=1 Tax=Hemibagrus guttatus TaxID=175788 RepID=A0AAE0R9K8_9TELE|nr:hypothetical protein QTP70_032176 [Hemibagrus guttatus]
MSDDLSPAGPKAPTGREGGKCGRRSPPPMRNEAERVPAMKRKKKQVSSGPSSADRNQAFLMQLLEWLLRGVSGVIMVNNPLSGALILIALSIASPWQALLGSLGLLSSTGTAILIGQQRAEISRGEHGYNGMLVALLIGVFSNAGDWYWWLLLPACLAGAATADLDDSLFGNLPQKEVWSDGQLVQGAVLGVGQIYACDNLGSTLIILAAVMLYSPVLAFHALLGSSLGMLAGERERREEKRREEKRREEKRREEKRREEKRREEKRREEKRREEKRREEKRREEKKRKEKKRKEKKRKEIIVFLQQLSGLSVPVRQDVLYTGLAGFNGALGCMAVGQLLFTLSWRTHVFSIICAFLSSYANIALSNLLSNVGLPASSWASTLTISLMLLVSGRSLSTYSIAISQDRSPGDLLHTPIQCAEANTDSSSV